MKSTDEDHGAGPSTDSEDGSERSLALNGQASNRTHDGGKKIVAIRLYICHALSTWNSRMFEFGAFLFLADVFPGTLSFASIYALARSLAAFLLSSWIGGLMDRSDRLVAIRHSISEQHLYSSTVVGLTDAQSGSGYPSLLRASSSWVFFLPILRTDLISSFPYW